MRTTLAFIATVLASFTASAGAATAASTIKADAGPRVQPVQRAAPLCPVAQPPNLVVSGTGFATWSPGNVFFNVTNASCIAVRKPFVVKVGGLVDKWGNVRPGVTVTIDGLAAGQTRTILAQAACETGRSIRVDSTNTVKETDETDNVAYSPWFIC